MGPIANKWLADLLCSLFQKMIQKRKKKEEEEVGQKSGSEENE